MFKTRNLALILLMIYVLPVVLFAQDEWDDEEDDRQKPGSEDIFDDDDDDDEEDSKKPKKKDKKNLDDILGGDEEEPVDDPGDDDPTDDPRDEPARSSDPIGDITGSGDQEKTAAPVSSAIKPFAVIKGGMYLMANWAEELTLTNGAFSKYVDQSLLFGGIDDAIFGAEYRGKAVFAKASISMRTPNALMSKAVNLSPRIDLNYNEGLSLFEAYGGMRLFGMLEIKGGKMVPAYGLLEEYQKLGAFIGTPYGTRSLIAVEGFIPETDTGFNLGLNMGLGDGQAIVANLMIANGTIDYSNNFWDRSETYALYIKAGYESKMVSGFASFQMANDYALVNQKSRYPKTMSFGVAGKVDIKGFEAMLSFDYLSMNLVRRYTAVDQQKSPATKREGNTGSEPASGMLFSVTPAYNLMLGVDPIEKMQIAVRFDYVKGVYNNNDNEIPFTGDGGIPDYLSHNIFSEDKSYMRIGAAVNIFAKEIENVRSVAGISLMMQPGVKVGGDKKQNIRSQYIELENPGFTVFMLTAGAEF